MVLCTSEMALFTSPARLNWIRPSCSRPSLSTCWTSPDCLTTHGVPLPPTCCAASVWLSYRPYQVLMCVCVYIHLPTRFTRPCSTRYTVLSDSLRLPCPTRYTFPVRLVTPSLSDSLHRPVRLVTPSLSDSLHRPCPTRYTVPIRLVTPSLSDSLHHLCVCVSEARSTVPPCWWLLTR